MALTDTAIRTAKPAAKNVKLSDEKCLYLLLTVTGGKWWRLDCRFEGKRKTLSMGIYLDIGLKEARERRDEARKILAQGIDPAEQRKAQKAAGLERAANSFEVIARMWHSTNAPKWSQGNADKIMNSLEKDIFPLIGGKSVDGGIDRRTC